MANTTAATRATPTGPWGLPAPAAAVESPPGGSEASRELETWRAGELESWRAHSGTPCFQGAISNCSTQIFSLLPQWDHDKQSSQILPARGPGR